MSLLKTYKEKLKKGLQKELGVKNIHEVPTLQKAIVSIGIGSLATRKGVKDFKEFEDNLAKITGQKPQMVRSKKAISNFKLREGMPVMLRVTLRREKAYDFVDKLVKIVLPRVRDFQGLSPRTFDARGTINIGFPTYQLFPELGLEDVTTPIGLQVTLVCSTPDKQLNMQFLKSLGILFLDK